MDSLKASLVCVVVIVLSIGGVARAQSAFTISGGTSFTVTSPDGGMQIPVGTTGYTNAQLTISRTRAYKFEFLGCGDTSFDNRFYLFGTNNFLSATNKIFDCKINRPGDSFIANLKEGDVGPHFPFHFQARADLRGVSVFNGEGPVNGTYTNFTFSNTSIFYAIDGSTSSPGLTSGDAVVLGFSDGGVPGDHDYQDLDVRITLP